MRRRRRGPAAVTERVDSGLAELVPDADRPGGWTLHVDGAPQSYVDLNDPTNLEFEYMRRLASVVDAVAPGGGRPLRVLHLGGGALTLPRYVAAIRPDSVQLVVERDAALIALVRRVLPLPRNANIRVRPADARAAIEASAPGRYDLVVSDVYSASRVPARFTTTEFAGAVARVLRPGGLYATNLADGRPLAFSRGQVVTLRSVFADVCLIAEPGVLRGRRFGNVVLAALAAPAPEPPSDPPSDPPRPPSGPAGGPALPVEALATAAARDVFPARLMYGRDLDRFTAGAQPVDDQTAEDSPEPPAGLFG